MTGTVTVRQMRAAYARQRTAGFDHGVAVRKAADQLGVRRGRVLGAVSGWKWWEGEQPRFYQPEPAGMGAFE